MISVRTALLLILKVPEDTVAGPLECTFVAGDINVVLVWNLESKSRILRMAGKRWPGRWMLRLCDRLLAVGNRWIDIRVLLRYPALQSFPRRAERAAKGVKCCGSRIEFQGYGPGIPTSELAITEAQFSIG
jgi:hypothetical protein